MSCANSVTSARRAAGRAPRVFRTLDLVLASACLLASSLVLLGACLLIKLDSPGPVIFRQRRLGRNQRPFTVHKLRTMRVDADPRVHRTYIEDLIGGTETAHSDGQRELYKLARDERITRVGRF